MCQCSCVGLNVVEVVTVDWLYTWPITLPPSPCPLHPKHDSHSYLQICQLFLSITTPLFLKLLLIYHLHWQRLALKKARETQTIFLPRMWSIMPGQRSAKICTLEQADKSSPIVLQSRLQVLWSTGNLRNNVLYGITWVALMKLTRSKVNSPEGGRSHSNWSPGFHLPQNDWEGWHIQPWIQFLFLIHFLLYRF